MLAALETPSNPAVSEEIIVSEPTELGHPEAVSETQNAMVSEEKTPLPKPEIVTEKPGKDRVKKLAVTKDRKKKTAFPDLFAAETSVAPEPASAEIETTSLESNNSEPETNQIPAPEIAPVAKPKARGRKPNPAPEVSEKKAGKAIREKIAVPFVPAVQLDEVSIPPAEEAPAKKTKPVRKSKTAAVKETGNNQEKPVKPKDLKPENPARK